MKKLMEITVKAWENENGRLIVQTSNEEKTKPSHTLNEIEIEVIKKVISVNEQNKKLGVNEK